MGAGAYLLWGMFPLYFYALKPSPPGEVLAHRIVWTALLCLLLVSVLGGWSSLLRVSRSRASMLALTAAAVLIAGNWFLYVIAVTTGNVIQAALGYYINPLVTVLLGVFFLKERLRPLQWAACGLALVAVLIIGIAYGRPPWISLGLAFSFGCYGLVKNKVGRTVRPLESLSVETWVLFLPALGWLGYLTATGTGTFGDISPLHTTMLALSGGLTAVPLLLFAGAAARIPLSLLGLLQYLTPTAQLLVGVLLLGESMSVSRWVGFGFIWTALVILSADMLRRGRRKPA